MYIDQNKKGYGKMISRIKESYKVWKLLGINKMTCVFSEAGIKNCANYKMWMHGGIWRMAELMGKIPPKLNVEKLTIEKAMEDI